MKAWGLGRRLSDGRKMIRNIVFDIGNVLTDYRWRGFLADQGYDEEMVERIGQASTLSPQWAEYDRGVWSYEEIIAGFVANDPEIRQDLEKVFQNLEGLVELRPYAISWMRALQRAGYKVYCLSNMSQQSYEDCKAVLSVAQEADGAILSYREKLVKPDPAIYRLLLDRYGLEAGETVFIDDMPENVEAARAVGLSGILFLEKSQVDGELRTLGVDWEEGMPEA